MIYTWIKNGKPDVSMCLNASLAGLVGVTAGTDAYDIIGSAAVGLVSGLLVVWVVEFLDLKLHIDDPVGAVGVHMANGIWGTVAVGLFANPDAPAGLKGLFYTGEFKQLGLQLLGFASVAAYAAVMMIITFTIIKKTNGLRTTAEEEILGLDITEHGLPSAYPDFMPSVHKYTTYDDQDVIAVEGDTPEAEAVPVKKMPTFDDGTGYRLNRIPHEFYTWLTHREIVIDPYEHILDISKGLRYTKGQARVLQRRCR